MVLHATKNLHKTLSHVRKLLKPGGKLLLLESTKDRLDTQVTFGALPGWWLGEEADRKMVSTILFFKFHGIQPRGLLFCPR